MRKQNESSNESANESLNASSRDGNSERVVDLETSYFKMVDVGAKTATTRRAQAQGRIELTPAAMKALVDLKNPKGNVLALSESAGIMAAKNVAQLLPLCHPLPIEQVRIKFELQSSTNSVLVFCEVAVTAKTGAEMEALAGVNGALLCIYDLSKAVDPVLKITDIRLNLKSGGKSGEWRHPELDFDMSIDFATAPATATATASSGGIAVPLPRNPEEHKYLDGISVAGITVSDRTSRGESVDQSGPMIQECIRAAGGLMAEHRIVSDDRQQIKNTFRTLALESTAQVIISSGGTGLSPRDVTPEALSEVCERMIPGFGELLRADGAKHIHTAWLSRSLAGILNGRILIALPGSPKAVKEGIAALAPLLPHALHTLRGGNHDIS